MSNSRGRFSTTLLTLRQCDITSLSARLNQYLEQRSFRPSSPPDPDYDKYTQMRTSTHKFLWWHIDLSLSDRVLGLRCWMCDTLAGNLLLFNREWRRKTQIAPLLEYKSHLSLSYRSGCDSLSVDSVCSHSFKTRITVRRVWCLKPATR